MAELRPVNVAANYFAGRNQASDEHQQGVRNKLANREMDLRENIYGANQREQQRQLTAEQEKQFATVMMQAAQYGIQSPTPKAFIEQNYPQLAQLAGDQWKALDDNGVKAKLQEAIGVWGPRAGIGPPSQQPKFTTAPGPRGSIIQTNPATGEQRQVVGPDNTQPSGASSRFRAMTPQELSTYGLPAGSSAQINDATGQVQVLNKPSVAPQQTAAERKAVIEAKVKMPRVAAAMRRADRLQEAVEAIAKNTAFDGGPADAKVLQYTKDGREVIAAAAQLMPELQALTRVPGIGSQSDLEARLAALALPSLEFDPQTNARSMAELQAFIQDLKAAYETIASGGAPAADVPDEAGPAVASQSAAPSLDDIRKKYGR